MGRVGKGDGFSALPEATGVPPPAVLVGLPRPPTTQHCPKCGVADRCFLWWRRVEVSKADKKGISSKGKPGVQQSHLKK